MIGRTGLDGFSVRDLARALETYPSAIYWHVRSRNQLLALVVAHVLRDVAPTRPHPSWQDWLRDSFASFRQAIRAHPAVAPLVGAQLVSNSGIDLGHVERTLATLARAGFAGARLQDAFNTVVAAQVGFVTLEFAPLPADDPADWAQGMQDLVGGVDREAYPVLGRNIGRLANRAFMLRWENGATAPMDRAFRAYVDTVIAGLEHLAAQSGIDPPEPDDYCPTNN